MENYFRRRHPELPATLADLVRDIGLTLADAKLLRQVYGNYYFLRRYAQAWPKAFPAGQASPASISMWNLNNLSKTLSAGMFSLARAAGGNERAAFERLRSATDQRDIASVAGLTDKRPRRKAG